MTREDEALPGLLMPEATLHRLVDQLAVRLAGRFATERLTAPVPAEGAVDSDGCEILSVCVHNAGRSQRAAALTAHHSGGHVHVRSAGSQPTPSIAAVVVTAELHPAGASR